MQFNDKFSIKDIFMDKELKGLFPQFNKKDKLKNVYSYEWIEDKIANYIKSVFNGRMSNGEIVIKGKFKQRFQEIKALQNVIEDMFNNLPAITKNIRNNTRLITPFQCKEQLKGLKNPRQKIMAMQIVLDNLNYNPEFQSGDRFQSYLKGADYFYLLQALY